MEKKNEYIDRLLQNLQNLEAKVTSIKQEESVPFSFFRDAFQKGQQIMHLLHEMEMFQIEDMKRQIEKLIFFLSESEIPKPVGATNPVEYEERDIEAIIEEPEEVMDIEEQDFHEETEKMVKEEENIRINAYAEGIVLPTYINPRNREREREEVINEVPALNKEEQVEDKPAIRSVNDVIQAPPAKLDIKRSLSLNDRFYYQRELFDNDREAMNSMMLRLNAFDNFDDTERYLREKTSWNFKDEKVKSFLELLKKGFE